jgi:hypothetical protein
MIVIVEFVILLACEGISERRVGRSIHSILL